MSIYKKKKKNRINSFIHHLLIITSEDMRSINNIKKRFSKNNHFQGRILCLHSYAVDLGVNNVSEFSRHIFEKHLSFPPHNRVAPSRSEIHSKQYFGNIIKKKKTFRKMKMLIMLTHLSRCWLGTWCEM